ncbi:MAG: efflux RND transporter periplasmic adaptor subunit [Ahniella sp.]|nr:efflux RND transporter periplasmic adaptor subunit [Ahniella sp.]
MINRSLRLPLLLALTSALLVACGGPGGPPQMPPQDVSVSTVVEKEVKDWDEYSGRIEAVDSVELRPRVTGYLAGVHFREGGTVAKGALLFTIDDREYRAAAAAAEADIARATARLELADRELARSQMLVEARAVSKGELDIRKGEQAQAAADLLAAQARKQQAELNLSFTRVTAPIAGRIGAALVKPGNLVAPGETLLTTLVSIDPVHVVFDGDERAYLRYQQMSRSGERGSSRDTANPVEVALADEATFMHRGQMDFVDNSINPTTGTIRGRAVLANPDGVFTPGLFARVRLMGANPRRALLIHDQAILTDQDRKYVWVVDAKGGAARKDIEPGESVDGLRVVERGLTVGDRVVVNGVRKIFFPGQPLKPREVPMDDPLQAAAAPAQLEAPAATSPKSEG